MGLVILLFLWLSMPLNVIFVEPVGEIFTDSEKQYALESIRNGYDFWDIPMPEVHTSDLQIASNPYASIITDWCTCVLVADISKTIYVIDNSESKLLLFGNQGGYAQNYFGIAVLVLDAAPVELSARVAHELGHVYYNLPDFYLTPGKCNQEDIMCYPQIPYQHKFKGCLTMELLGTPCYKVSLPLVEH